MIAFDDSEFVRTVNFFKKQDNWEDIFDTAATNVANDILTDAKEKVYLRLNRRTGELAESIDIDVSTLGNYVELTLGSYHPAAAIVEFGGYSPFPPWGEESGLDFPVAKKIFENQPFAEPRPYLRPALENGRGAFESEVIRTARSMSP